MVYAIIAQVESLLRKYEPNNEIISPATPAATNEMVNGKQMPTGLITAYGTSSFSPPSRNSVPDEPLTQAHPKTTNESDDKQTDDLLNANFSWEMIELGLEEPLPVQEILEDLYELRLALENVLG